MKSTSNPRHWLMKSEPDCFSLADLKKKVTSGWDGVRNYQARNFMREMALGDQVLFYHSNAKPPGIAGLATVSALAHPDPTQFDPNSQYFDPKATPTTPRWFMVEVRYVKTFTTFIPLETLHQVPELSAMVLLQRSRLSVQPVTPQQYQTILSLARLRSPGET